MIGKGNEITCRGSNEEMLGKPIEWIIPEDKREYKQSKE
jgi:hypothetical protein